MTTDRGSKTGGTAETGGGDELDDVFILAISDSIQIWSKAGGDVDDGDRPAWIPDQSTAENGGYGSGPKKLPGWGIW